MAEDSPFGVVMAKVAGVHFVSEVGESKSFLLVILGTVIGAGLSLFLASGVLTGIGAGAGIVTGLKCGACLTVEAAKAKGYIRRQQVEELLTAAAQQIAEEKLGNEAALTDGDTCQKVVADLKKAAQDVK